MQKTIVSFLLDRTGSMMSIRDDTIGGFNAYRDKLEQDAGDLIEFTLVQFDTTSVDKVCVGVAMKDVPRLSHENYVPRDGTPLIDAAYKIIKATEAVADKRTDLPKVVVCLMTDGEENSSKEFTLAQLQELVRAKRAAGWEINFMGCGFDAYQTAASFGVARGHTVSYGRGQTIAAMATQSANTAAYASGQRTNSAYTVNQKRAMGDAYDIGGAVDDDATAPTVTTPSPPPPKPKKDAFKPVEDFTLDH